ncbi:MAG: hypothetical protein IIV28_02635, partial [Alistipes sp.]|nr:hypothetical protein [Alistipes sp.]
MEISFLLLTAAAAAAAAVAATAFGIRAADALGAAFLGLVDIESRTTQNCQDHNNNYNIYHRLFLSAECIVFFQLIVCVDAQKYHNANHQNHSDQAAAEACANTSCGDQSTDLIDQESESITYAQL